MANIEDGGGSTRKLIRQWSSLRDDSMKFSSKKNMRFFDEGFCEAIAVNKESLGLDYGLDEKFIYIFTEELQEHGVGISIRSKLIEGKNISHAPKSRGKPVTMKVKTSTNNVTMAALVVKQSDIDGDVVPAYPENSQSEVFKCRAHDQDLFVTYLRRSLNIIQAQVESGAYILEKVSLPAPPGIPYIIISDPSDRDNKNVAKQYKIVFKNCKEPTGELSPVVKIKKRFEKKSVKATATGKEQQEKIDAQKKLEDFEKLTKSHLFTNNLDDTVRILPYDPITKTVDNVARCVCDEFGNLIKGDVDQQNVFLPDNLPPASFKTIEATTVTDLLAALRVYKNQLQAQYKTNIGTSNKIDIYFITMVDKAIKRLESVDQKQSGANRIVTDLGVINIFCAAMLLALDTKILHGNDARSPIFPENIAAIQLPDPENRNLVLITHSEFEYLTLLHKNDLITKNKVTDFNPCWLVEAPAYKVNGVEIKWRKDLGTTTDVNGNKHSCNNLTDEHINIELWKLTLEKQLLSYKLSHSPDTYKEFIDVMLDDCKKMTTNKLTMKTPELVEALESGIIVMQNIVDHIEEKYQFPEDINDRLTTIKAITTDTSAEQIKRNVDASIVARKKHGP